MSVPGVPSMASVSQITSTLLKQIYTKTSKRDGYDHDDLLSLPDGGDAPLAPRGLCGSAHAANHVEANHSYLMGDSDSDSGLSDSESIKQMYENTSEPSMASVSQITSTLLKQIYTNMIMKDVIMMTDYMTSKRDGYDHDGLLSLPDGCDAPLAPRGLRGSAHAANHVEVNHGYLLDDSDSGSSDGDSDDSDGFANADAVGSPYANATPSESPPAEDCDLASDADSMASKASLWSRVPHPEDWLEIGMDKMDEKCCAVDSFASRYADKLEQKLNDKASYVAKISSATKTKGDEMRDVVVERGLKVVDYASDKFDIAAEKVNASYVGKVSSATKTKAEDMRDVAAEKGDEIFDIVVERGSQVLDYATDKFDFAQEKVCGGVSVVAERSKAISKAAQTKSENVRSKASGSIENLRSKTLAAKGFLFSPMKRKPLTSVNEFFEAVRKV